MFGQVVAITRNTFVESIRQPVFIVLILAGAGFQVINLLLSAFTLGFTEETEVSGDDKLLLDMGLATVMVIAMLLAAFVATSVLSREIENKTALTVISKPVGRPVFVLGKYLGVTGAIFVAVVILTTFLLFVIRHEVMSTARDTVDLPVLFFSMLGILVPIGFATWGNYFYGWVFSSTATLTMAPATVVGYIATLGLSKDLAWQSLATDFKPQVTLAAALAMVAILVLTSVAVAASTRLGQVMTLVVCSGVFLLGLLSNHLLGRHVFANQSVGAILTVENLRDVPMTRGGDSVSITLEAPPSSNLRQGRSIYYGSDPLGIEMAVPVHPDFTGDVSDIGDIQGPNSIPAMVISSRDTETNYQLMNTGSLPVTRPPQVGDYLFLTPTRTNWAARIGWSVIPNIQVFWLVDAITQGHSVPGRYLVLVTGYGGVQIVMFLSLAVLLFQRREVG
jgi:hypothetical protein